MSDNNQNNKKSKLDNLITPTKILSICIPGRDDNYFEDFKYRINTTINHLARSIKNSNLLDDVEILITDWGSDIPIYQTLNLSQEATKITRFIYVEPEIICGVTKSGRDDWHMSIPPNVAARRATGKYILTYPGDTLISQYSFETLIRFLNNEILISVDLECSYFLIPRYDVPWQFLERQPDLVEWDRYFSICSKNTPLENSGIFSFFGDAGGFLMHHSLWNKFRGFDEPNYEYSSNDVELGFRVTQYYPHLSLSSIGVFLYHMGHPPGRGRRIFIQKNVKPTPIIYNTKLYVNDENWGLGDIDFNLQQALPKKTALESGINSEIVPEDKVNYITKSLNLEDFQRQIKNVDILQNLKKSIYYSKGQELNKGDLNALFLLAWYSYFNYPRRYLEFFTGLSPATGIVAAMCPSVEIFKADRLEGVAKQNNPFDISYIYTISPFRGYLRMINGDIQTAINRITDTFIGIFTFDIAFIKEETIGGEFQKHLISLLPYLTQGGALVFNCCSTDSYKSIMNKVEEYFPQLTLISCSDKRSGMFLVNSIINNGQKLNPVEGISFNTSFITSLLLKKKIINTFKPIVIKWMSWAFNKVHS